MFPITITLQNHNQLNAVMAALGNHDQFIESQQPVVPSSTSDTKAKTAASSAKTETAKQEAASVVEEAATTNTTVEASSVEATTEAQPTYQDVAAKITQVSRSVGREAAVKLLESFDAKRGPDLKPEQYADVMAACEKVLA